MLHHELKIENVIAQIKAGDEITVKNITKNCEYTVILSVSDRQKDMLYAGGLLNYTKETGK